MCYLSNICFMCLKDIDTLQTVYLNRREDVIKQINYALPEIALEPEIPVHTCSTCHTQLNSFCKFKKQCLENYCCFTKKLRESGNTKDQSFNAFQIEFINIKEENQVDADLTSEAPEEFNSQINLAAKKNTIKAVQDDTLSPGFKRNINEVSGMTVDIKNFKCEEQHNQINNYIEDNIYIEEDIIKFENCEVPNLYQELPDIKKETDSEQGINEIESAALYINTSESTVSNLIFSNFHQKINEESGTKEKIKSFGCKMCNKMFIQKSDLKRHIEIHTGIKNYQCSICKTKFILKSYLKRHMKTHTCLTVLQCSICEKQFIRNSNLKLHMKTHLETHTGSKDFQCSICEKTFMQNNYLKLHMRTHTCFKDFQCSICETKFLRKSNFDMHMKTHTGIKDFQCSICDKKFMRKSHLKRHMNTHSRIKDYQCTVCDKKFIRKSYLKRHTEETHTDIKDFE